MRDQLLAFLQRELTRDGLTIIRFYQHEGILFRTRCELPYLSVLDKRKKVADYADVLLFRKEKQWHVHMEHPNAGCVLHPNWDADGYWHNEQILCYKNTTREEMRDLLRYIIHNLNFKEDTYSLMNVANRNAVAWCFANGKDNRRIHFVSDASTRPRFCETRSIQINSTPQ